MKNTLLINHRQASISGQNLSPLVCFPGGTKKKPRKPVPSLNRMAGQDGTGTLKRRAIWDGIFFFVFFFESDIWKPCWQLTLNRFGARGKTGKKIYKEEHSRSCLSWLVKGRTVTTMKFSLLVICWNLELWCRSEFVSLLGLSMQKECSLE